MAEWFLSDEQMGSIRSRDVPVSWERIELPVGPHPVPSWARGLEVNFWDGCGNAPTYSVITREDLRSWTEKRFRREGPAYIGEHPDGRAEVYYHSGAVSPQKVRRFQTPDGQTHSYRPYQPFGLHHRRGGHTWQIGHGVKPGEWVEVERLCTTAQGGFGGSHIYIVLDDGIEMVLRGPWHGGAPKGFVEVSYRNKHGKYPTAARAGLYLREDLFILLFARFAPHLELVRYQGPLGERIQPLKPEWDCPKDVWMQREKDAHLRRTLSRLASADGAVETVMDREHDFAPWALMNLAHQKLAERHGAWNSNSYVITDLGRSRAAEMEAAHG